MAILFFDGFDRCTITKQLDRNYWSFQPQVPVEYEKYAFGGYSYDHTVTDYSSNYYSTYSPNNGHLPISKYNAAGALNTAANSHPGFGAPQGFLALNNLDISDSSMLAPLTYLQVSGFSLPQSGESFLNFRIHGIETKDSNYHSSDVAGRFGAKHPLVAFCSGNTTGLIFNIVKVTGNQLETVENTKMTIGLEVEQLAGASGSFDLNIGNDLQNYRIRSLYSDGSAAYHSGTAQPVDLSDLEGRILMPVTDRNTTSPYIPQSRWCHFTLGIIQTGVTPEIKVKLDDIDLLTIPTDDTITDKDLWDSKIGISGFNYDNIRFFNRTYNASIPIAYTSYDGYGGGSYSNQTERVGANYYERGANTLLDDIILNDGSGTANTFLGKTAKVIPFTPGVRGQYSTDLSDNSPPTPDPYREWTTNATSHKVALKNLDGDNGKISSPTIGKRTAVPYGSGNIQIPSAALDNWRYEIQDAIGGMKVYTVAKKEFLDSAFIPILKTGEIDQTFHSVTEILIRPEDGVTDAVEKQTISTFNGQPTITDIKPFTRSGLLFNDSYLTVRFAETADLSNEFYNSHLRPNQTNNSPDNRFAIESWVYFTGGSKPIELYTTTPPTGYDDGNPTREQHFAISCDSEGITYDMFLSGELNFAHPLQQRVKLLFNTSIPTGEWHHVAFLMDGIEETNGTIQYPVKAFLDGVAGNKYVLTRDYGQPYNRGDGAYNFKYERFPQSNTSGRTFPRGGYGGIGDIEYPGNNYLFGADLNIDKNMLGSLSCASGSIVGSGTLNNPATGTFTFIARESVTNFSFTAEDTGSFYIRMSGIKAPSDTSNPTFEIYINDQQQQTDQVNESPDLDYVMGLPTSDLTYASRQVGQLMVNSGDIVSMKNIVPTMPGGHAAPDTVSTGIITSMYIASPTGVGTYYMSKGDTNDTKHGSFQRFQQRFKNGGTNFNNATLFPTFIAGNHIISDYRLTLGSASDNGISKTRYRDNFEAPTQSLSTDRDSYIDLGENISLTKTRYGKTREFFVLENPITNQPWTTGLIADPSGLILGVRKT